MALIRCPYLDAQVELSEAREFHIAESHPDLLPEYRERLAEVVAEPEVVRRSTRFAGAWLFSRWYDAIRGGKHVVVVIVSEPPPAERHWVITAYLARRLSGGEVTWKRG